MDNSNSESLFLENIFSEENVIRCPICYLIPNNSQFKVFKR